MIISPIMSTNATAISTAMRFIRSEEHTSELQSPCNLVCRLLLEKKKTNTRRQFLSRFVTYPYGGGLALLSSDTSGSSSISAGAVGRGRGQLRPHVLDVAGAVN